MACVAGFAGKATRSGEDQGVYRATLAAPARCTTIAGQILRCSVAPSRRVGWPETEAFKPDGVVWLDESPFGGGWHYIVNALHAKSRSTMKKVMNRALADARTDQFPIVVVCRDEMEELVWELGAGRAVLTASATRVRSLPVVGQDGNAWLHSGKAAPMLSNRQRNAREEVN